MRILILLMFISALCAALTALSGCVTIFGSNQEYSTFNRFHNGPKDP